MYCGNQLLIMIIAINLIIFPLPINFIVFLNWKFIQLWKCTYFYQILLIFFLFSGCPFKRKSNSSKKLNELEEKISDENIRINTGNCTDIYTVLKDYKNLKKLPKIYIIWFNIILMFVYFIICVIFYLIYRDIKLIKATKLK